MSIYSLGFHRIWFFTTSHGDDERGDVFDSTKSARTVKDVSHVQIYVSYINKFWQFFDAVVTEAMQQYFLECTVVCFMLVCGGMVSYAESKDDLKSVFAE
jgi:hypothetical protein